MEGRDGNVYVTNSVNFDDEDGSGDIYRFAPGGSVTELTSFEEYPEIDSNLSGPLVEGQRRQVGRDGTATDGGDDEGLATWRTTTSGWTRQSAGKVTNIHHFSCTRTENTLPVAWCAGTR